MLVATRHRCVVWLNAALLLGVALGPASFGDESAFSKSVPESVADLRAIEQHVTKLVEQVLPATVALQVGRAQASGVIVSADGYILTAAHVIERPGRSVTVIFSNGRTAQGKTLGMNPQVDGGLVQITDQGPWPFAPIAPHDVTPKPGDWCLALGHPGGFQPRRSPPVRLGRVIDTDRAIIRTDCTITMGDSGGPLFDMEGRVIGIHSRIADETTINLHVPAATYQDAWDVLKAGEVAQRPSRFLTRMDANGDGKISRSEVREDIRPVFDRMVAQLELDPEGSHSIAELTKSLGLDAPKSFDGSQLLLPMRVMRPGDTLPPERFARGKSVRSVFRPIVGDAWHGTVRVKSEGKEVALGAIVSADGLIVTKASELTVPTDLVCVLSDHQELPARLVASDSGADVALLKVQATKLSPLQFVSAELRPGMWLASVGQTDQPVAIGVVSIAERAIAGNPGVLGVVIDDLDEGPFVRQVMPGGGAAAAGIQVGDLFTQIERDRVRNLEQLKAAVSKHRVGELVTAAIVREGTKMEIRVRLGTPEDSFTEPPAPNRGRGPNGSGASFRGALSQRRDDFPAAVQTDTVLRPQDCGGPVVDSAGRVVGLNIARADRTASYVLPAATVQAQIKKLWHTN
jgi:S1-C subfamily serine protease